MCAFNLPLVTIVHLVVPLYVGHHALHVHLTAEHGPVPRLERQVPHHVLDGRHTACSHWKKILKIDPLFSLLGNVKASPFLPVFWC